MFDKTMVRGLFVAVVVGLTALSGSNANTIQFADAFNGSTLDPFWNANYINVPLNYWFSCSGVDPG
jgi:hypothetical protein